jgi:hypothetical protein
MALVQYMVPRVMQLTPTYQRATQADDDVETAKGCVRCWRMHTCVHTTHTSTRVSH